MAWIPAAYGSIFYTVAVDVHVCFPPESAIQLANWNCVG